MASRNKPAVRTEPGGTTPLPRSRSARVKATGPINQPPTRERGAKQEAEKSEQAIMQLINDVFVQPERASDQSIGELNSIVNRVQHLMLRVNNCMSDRTKLFISNIANAPENNVSSNLDEAVHHDKTLNKHIPNTPASPSLSISKPSGQYSEALQVELLLHGLNDAYDVEPHVDDEMIKSILETDGALPSQLTLPTLHANNQRVMDKLQRINQLQIMLHSLWIRSVQHGVRKDGSYLLIYPPVSSSDCGHKPIRVPLTDRFLESLYRREAVAANDKSSISQTVGKRSLLNKKVNLSNYYFAGEITFNKNNQDIIAFPINISDALVQKWITGECKLKIELYSSLSPPDISVKGAPSSPPICLAKIELLLHGLLTSDTLDANVNCDLMMEPTAQRSVFSRLQAMNVSHALKRASDKLGLLSFQMKLTSTNLQDTSQSAYLPFGKKNEDIVNTAVVNYAYQPVIQHISSSKTMKDFHEVNDAFNYRPKASSPSNKRSKESRDIAPVNGIDYSYYFGLIVHRVVDLFIPDDLSSFIQSAGMKLAPKRVLISYKYTSSDKDSLSIHLPAQLHGGDYSLDVYQFKIHRLTAPLFHFPVLEVWLEWGHDSLSTTKRLLGWARLDRPIIEGEIQRLPVMNITDLKHRGSIIISAFSASSHYRDIEYQILRVMETQRQLSAQQIQVGTQRSQHNLVSVDQPQQQPTVAHRATLESNNVQETASVQNHHESKEEAVCEEKGNDIELEGEQEEQEGADNDMIPHYDLSDSDVSEDSLITPNTLLKLSESQREAASTYDRSRSDELPPHQIVARESYRDHSPTPLSFSKNDPPLSINQNRALSSQSHSSHVLDISVDGVCDIFDGLYRNFAIRGNYSLDYVVRGVFICYSLPGLSSSSSNMLSSIMIFSSSTPYLQSSHPYFTLWWDAECALLNGKNRHSFQANLVSVYNLCSALGVTPGVGIEMLLIFATDDGEMPNEARPFAKAFLSPEQLLSAMNQPIQTVDISLQILHYPDTVASQGSTFTRQSFTLPIKIQGHTEPALLRTSLQSVSQPNEDLTNPFDHGLGLSSLYEEVKEANVIVRHSISGLHENDHQAHIPSVGVHIQIERAMRLSNLCLEESAALPSHQTFLFFDMMIEDEHDPQQAAYIRASSRLHSLPVHYYSQLKVLEDSISFAEECTLYYPINANDVDSQSIDPSSSLSHSRKLFSALSLRLVFYKRVSILSLPFDDISEEDRISPLLASDLEVGQVVVGLAVLDYGIEEIDGWYHIVDPLQRIVGQVKLKVNSEEIHLLQLSKQHSTPTDQYDSKEEGQDARAATGIDDNLQLGLESEAEVDGPQIVECNEAAVVHDEAESTEDLTREHERLQILIAELQIFTERLARGGDDLLDVVNDSYISPDHERKADDENGDYSDSFEHRESLGRSSSNGLSQESQERDTDYPPDFMEYEEDRDVMSEVVSNGDHSSHGSSDKLNSGVQDEDLREAANLIDELSDTPLVELPSTHSSHAGEKGESYIPQIGQDNGDQHDNSVGDRQILELEESMHSSESEYVVFQHNVNVTSGEQTCNMEEDQGGVNDDEDLTQGQQMLNLEDIVDVDHNLIEGQRTFQLEEDREIVNVILTQVDDQFQDGNSARSILHGSQDTQSHTDSFDSPLHQISSGDLLANELLEYASRSNIEQQSSSSEGSFAAIGHRSNNDFIERDEQEEADEASLLSMSSILATDAYPLAKEYESYHNVNRMSSNSNADLSLVKSDEDLEPSTRVEEEEGKVSTELIKRIVREELERMQCLHSSHEDSCIKPLQRTSTNTSVCDQDDLMHRSASQDNEAPHEAPSLSCSTMLDIGVQPVEVNDNSAPVPILKFSVELVPSTLHNSIRSSSDKQEPRPNQTTAQHVVIEQEGARPVSYDLRQQVDSRVRAICSPTRNTLNTDRLPSMISNLVGGEVRGHATRRSSKYPGLKKKFVDHETERISKIMMGVISSQHDQKLS